MQTITRLLGSFDPLMVEIDMSESGKALADVSDIFFMIKRDPKSEDNAIFLKKRSTGGISATEAGSVITAVIEWAEDEYSNFILNEKYTAGLFLKFIGDPTADEHVDQLVLIVIKQDFSRG